MEKTRKKFKYILRLAIDPYVNSTEALNAAMKFCRMGEIDDLTMFVAGEELSEGHLTFEEQSKYIDLFKRVKEKTEQMGITFSVNTWSTLYPGDRGRSLAPGQSFGLMMDVRGRTASVTACPICENFRDYYIELSKRYAELSPHIFWIEDDFRFHNHSPLEWGGCFCERHMEEFSKRAGETLDRSEFVRAVLQPGNPHPYRKLLLDFCNETLVKFAAEISGAIHQISPGTALGLMSSDPSVHCAEGRDWLKLFEALSGGGRKIHRIHLPSYLERVPQEYLWYFNTVSMMAGAIAPDDAVIYPELENYPFTQYSKSQRFTRFQIESALALGIEGITLDLYEILGTGICLDDGQAGNLKESKKFLNACTDSGVFSWQREGIAVLVSQSASYNIHTEIGVSMEELYPKECFWGGVLTGLGIPSYYHADPKLPSGRITAVSGQFFRNLTPCEISQLFENNYVIMDGLAALTLHQMGAGHFAGIRSIKRIAQDTGTVAYEQSVQNEEGFILPRASSQIFLGDSFIIDYTLNFKEISSLINCRGQKTAPGMVVFNDRVLVLPYECGGYPHLMFNRLRKLFIGRELKKAAEHFTGCSTMVENGINAAAYEYRNKDASAIYLINASTDHAGQIRLWAPCLVGKSLGILSGKGYEALEYSAENGCITIKTDLNPMDCALITTV